MTYEPIPVSVRMRPFSRSARMTFWAVTAAMPNSAVSITTDGTRDPGG